MKYIKEKLFWHARDTSKDVVCVFWDEKEEYYSFVKRELDSGCHQISITSEIMLKIISTFLQSGPWIIDKIEMMEDDDDLSFSLDKLIESCRRNPRIILSLIEYLRSIIEDSSIEIKRIYLSERDEKGTLKSVFIQVNGIIGIYNGIDEINSMLCTIMREYI